ncbi:uncharacterized protein K489DRAFT_400879 [Dissoconium aciculare CBS 342.82]|uniref:Uncharacterized protein n=1 Tax=Dissoconium aciculare CBS 342.82 TaxID=1314786 RepID=A0A6J3M9T5_9PEZI|nr:uncharacterized protein K489DRAFT_400879 [Dissoconium aciculare CBS 342.82]KAF1823577.1 hypothetical protein K489DRAFT_400879 [Dissoconium aciculare CBS 342.82]
MCGKCLAQYDHFSIVRLRSSAVCVLWSFVEGCADGWPLRRISAFPAVPVLLPPSCHAISQTSGVVVIMHAAHMAKVSMAMPSSSANGDETTMTTLVDDDVDDVYQKQSLRHALPTPGRPWCRSGFIGETTGQYLHSYRE